MTNLNISEDSLNFWKKVFKVAIPSLGITALLLGLAGLLLGMKII